MKKQDMIDAIQSKYETVFSVTEKEELENVKWYVAYVFDATGDNATKRNVGFYVKNEGTVDEKAFWHGNEPKPTPPTPIPTFQQKLQEHLTALIAAGTIEGGTIQAIDAVNETATVSVWIESSGNIVLKQFFINKDAQNNWQRREIIS